MQITRIIFFEVLPLLLFASFRFFSAAALGQQANHLCSCQRFWSTSDAFWWSVFLFVDISRTVRTLIDLCQYIVQPQIHLEPLSVTFILNVRGFFIGLRNSFKLLPFLFQLRDLIAFERRKNLIDQLRLRRRVLRYNVNVGLGDGRRRTTLCTSKARRTLLTHRNEMK